jgi:trk system potassium uptake protein TrkA
LLGKVAIIGLGRFGRALARSLAAERWPVLAIDTQMTYIEQVSAIVDKAICMDATNEESLASAGIQDMNTVVVSVGTHSIENSIMITALLKQLGVPRIIARSTSPLHSRILRLVGAHEVINPEEEAAARLALRIMQPGIIDLRALSTNIVISEVNVPSSFLGKSLIELDIRRRYGVSVLAIRRPWHQEERRGAASRAELVIPQVNDRFGPDDILLVLGSPDDVARLSNLD